MKHVLIPVPPIDWSQVRIEPPAPMTLLRAYGPPKPETWQILDKTDANGPWWLVRDRNYAGYSPIHVMGPDSLSMALSVWWRRSVA